MERQASRLRNRQIMSEISYNVKEVLDQQNREDIIANSAEKLNEFKANSEKL